MGTPPRRRGIRLAAAVAACLSAFVLTGRAGAEAEAAGVRGAVHPLLNLSSPATCQFPSDRFSVADRDQLTGRRVDLPLPGRLLRQRLRF